MRVYNSPHTFEYAPLMLYDAPVHRGYEVLTSTSKARYGQNALNQVGNELFPKHAIQSRAIVKSAIYNKNLNLRAQTIGPRSGFTLGEAGYGDAFPYKHLSYAGAGSYPAGRVPRSLRDAYINDNPQFLPKTGAVSVPRLGYAGAGSYPAGRVPKSLAYAGAGSYPAGRVPKSLRGIGDEGPTQENSFWGQVTGAFGTLFSTAVSSGTNAAQAAINNAINHPVTTNTQSVQTNTPQGGSVSAPSTNFLGIAGMSTLTLAGLGLVVYLALKKS